MCKKFFSFTALKGDDWVETFLISKQNIGWEQSILTRKKIYWLGTKYIGSQKKQYVIYFCTFTFTCLTDEPFVIDRFLSASYHINWIIVSKLKKCEGHESRYNLSVLTAFSNSSSLEGFNGNLVLFKYSPFLALNRRQHCQFQFN